MECIPAIDLRAGRCVRLLRGEFAHETVYGDPVEVAVGYCAAGARFLHIVDLDAARTGSPANRGLVLDVIESVRVPVQLGGGLRDERSVEEALDAGVARVVVGTLAVGESERTRRLADRFPGQIVVGLDHRPIAGSASKREVAIRGWEEGAGIDLLDAIDGFAGAPLGAVVVTDIGRDGTLDGPDLEGYIELLSRTDLPIIASGGIGGVADLLALAAIEVESRRLAGTVIGRALLDGRLTVGEAVAACAT